MPHALFAFSVEVICEFLPHLPLHSRPHFCIRCGLLHVLPFSKTSLYQHVLNNLNAVRLLHRYNGCTVDALDSFEVSLTKRGLKRLLGTTTHQKHPITPTILLNIGHHLDTSLPFHSTIWALFWTAFFSFLRKSSLTVALATSFYPSRHFTHHDIKFTASGAFLRIHWMKTL